MAQTTPRLLRATAASVLGSVLAVVAGIQVVVAADKEYRWDAIDVDLSLGPNGDLRVMEQQTFRFIEGTFSHAYRDVDLVRLDDIQNAQVLEGGRPYSSGLGQPGQFATSTQNAAYRIEWWFEPTERAARTFAVAYTVQGVVRRHEPRDELWWKAAGRNRGQVVTSSTVTLHLPADVRSQDIGLSTQGAPTDAGRPVDPRTVAWRGGPVLDSQDLVVSLEFPHGLVGGSTPAWQVEEERRAAYDENLRPVVNVLVAALSALVLVAGIAVLARRSRAADAAPSSRGTLGSFVGPPDDLPPGLAGVLLDKEVRRSHLMATILDLARRGMLRIEELSGDARGALGGGTEHRLTRLADRRARPHPFEQTLIDALFSQTGSLAPNGAGTVAMNEARVRLVRSSRAIRAAMYEELTQAGLMPSNPDGLRSAYAAGGMFIAVAGLVVGIAVWVLLIPWTDLGGLPLLALGLVGIILAVNRRALVPLTPTGAERAAHWKRFRAYLATLGGRPDDVLAGEALERDLPYAVAFGLESTWLAQVARSERRDDWIPGWYGYAAVDGGGADSVVGATSLDQVIGGLGGLLRNASVSPGYLSWSAGWSGGDSGGSSTSWGSGDSGGGWSGGGNGGSSESGSGGGGGGAN